MRLVVVVEDPVEFIHLTHNVRFSCGDARCGIPRKEVFMARSALPTTLKMVKGTRTGRVNHDEPQPEPGVPTCPTDDPEVREIWDYTMKQLLTMRTITMADRDT